MDETGTQASEGGTDMAERYIGPSARRIADLLPHRVSFERDWFWTTTAICHGGKSDALAFRQRPDGEGIDVRCRTGCSPGLIITELEVLIGQPIWAAYESVGDEAVKAPVTRQWWTRKRFVVAGVVALVVAAPLLLGLGLETTVLNLVGLGIVALLLRRFLVGRALRKLRR